MARSTNPSRHKRSRGDGQEEAVPDLTSAVASPPAASPPGGGRVAELWRDGKLCDVDVCVEGRTFPAHRLVLAASSDFMSALLAEDRFADSGQRRIELMGESLTADAFERVLEWMYTGSFEVNRDGDGGTGTGSGSESAADGYDDLLAAAVYLQCGDLISRLEETIVDRLEAGNCLSTLSLAERVQLPGLEREAMGKLLDCYGELSGSSEEFVSSLTSGTMLRLLASDDLKVPNEENVFCSLMGWARAQPHPPPAEVWDEMLSLVRYNLMSRKFLAERVETEPLLLGSSRGLLSLARSLREETEGNRARRRRGYTLTWDEIEKGMRVRVKGDEDTVRELCERPAPGASFCNGWVDNMRAYIGRKVVVRHLYGNCYRSVVVQTDGGDFCNFPFDALEHVDS